MTALLETDELSKPDECTIVSGPTANKYEPDATDRLYEYGDTDAEMFGVVVLPQPQPPLAVPLPGPAQPVVPVRPQRPVRQHAPPRHLANYVWGHLT